MILGACGAAAIAAWLAPASMQIVAWPARSVGRIGLFAPAADLKWAIVAALAAASAVWWIGPSHARARRAAVLAPLNALWLWVIPFVPWIPDRLPLLVIFGGPIRWLIAAVAIGVCAVRALRRGSSRATRFLPGRRVAFAVALLLYLYAGHRSLAMVGLGGDEPHYLVITQSLLLDHDLQIENNHQRGDYREYFPGALRPDYLARGTNGAIYSIHAPGLAVLVAPGFQLAGAWGAMVTVCLFGAFAALAVFDLAALIGGTAAAWATWAAVSLTVPFVPHAWSIFPEMPAAAVAAWALLWIARDEQASWPAWCWRGVCLAILPWLHTKFTVLLAVLTLGLIWRICMSRPAAEGLKSRRDLNLAALAVPIALSSIGWLVFFRIIYGTFDPQSPYGTYTAQFVMLTNIPRGLAGSLFDQKFGLLIYAPVYAASIVGAAWLIRETRWRIVGVVSVGLAVVYLLSSVRLYMWWGGSSAPARFLVPVGPLLAPSLAIVFARLRGGLAAAHLWFALGVSLFIAALSIVDMAPPLLFSSPHGVARLAEWLQSGGPLTAALPTFTEEDWRTPLVKLAVWACAIGGGVVCASVVASRRRRSTEPTEGASHERSLFMPLVVEGVVTVVIASAASVTYSTDARAETVQRGRMALLTRFDPDAIRGLDYRDGRLTKLTPERWIDAGHLEFDIRADADPDPLGRLTDGLSLPPGSYEIGVTFASGGPHAGDLLAAAGGGQVIARADGPLGSRVLLPARVPVPVPHLWVQLTDPASTRDARRVDLIASAIVPQHERPDVEVRSVESVPRRPGAYIAYTNDDAFPEGGVFWTRGTEEGEVLLAPAGSRTAVVTLHVGPPGGTVHVRVGGASQGVTLTREETRQLTVDLPAGAPYVPVRVQVSSAFRPADYDPQSTDRRLLGCQVRIEVEP
jgi:hypothetical protein